MLIKTSKEEDYILFPGEYHTHYNSFNLQKEYYLKIFDEIKPFETKKVNLDIRKFCGGYKLEKDSLILQNKVGDIKKGGKNANRIVFLKANFFLYPHLFEFMSLSMDFVVLTQ